MRFSILVALLAATACTKAAPPPPSATTAKTAASTQMGQPEVVMETTHGKLVVRLYGDKAPISTKNFLEYVDAHFYDGTIFHRVIPEYVLQGGGFDKSLQPKPTRAPIRNEADNGLKNRRGTVAMARTNVPDSATSQFFINVHDNSKLDHSSADFGYAVIGEITEGMGVVDLIRNLPTRCPSWTGQPCRDKLPPGMRDVPVDPVVITKAYRR